MLPAAIARTPTSPAGTLAWPLVLPPHAITTPSLRSAIACVEPALIAVGRPTELGTSSWLLLPRPHALTRLSETVIWPVGAGTVTSGFSMRPTRTQ